MEPSLDSMLTDSAPPITARTADLERGLHALVTDAESCAAPARRGLRSRLAISGLTAVGLFGLSAGASAAGVLPTPEWAPWYENPATTHTQTTASGGVCEFSYAIKEVNKDSVNPAAQAAAVAEATDFLRRFDFSAINVSEAIRHVPSTTVLSEDPEEREAEAVYAVVAERLDAHLAKQGLSRAGAALSMAVDCPGGGS